MKYLPRACCGRPIRAIARVGDREIGELMQAPSQKAASDSGQTDFHLLEPKHLLPTRGFPIHCCASHVASV